MICTRSALEVTAGDPYSRDRGLRLRAPDTGNHARQEADIEEILTSGSAVLSRRGQPHVGRAYSWKSRRLAPRATDADDHLRRRGCPGSGCVPARGDRRNIGKPRKSDHLITAPSTGLACEHALKCTCTCSGHGGARIHYGRRSQLCHDGLCRSTPQLQVPLVARPRNQNFNGRLTIGRSSRGAAAPRFSVQASRFPSTQPLRYSAL